MQEQALKCPKCSSAQLTAGKKGFSGKKAVAGALLTGGIGLLAGTIGSNKVQITCLACGHQFAPGNDLIAKENKRKQEAEAMKSPGTWVFLIVMICFLMWLFSRC